MSGFFVVIDKRHSRPSLWHCQAGSGLNNIADDEAYRQGERRHDDEVHQRNSAGPPHRCSCSNGADPQHNRAENNGRDHHFDQRDEEFS